MLEVGVGSGLNPGLHRQPRTQTSACPRRAEQENQKLKRLLAEAELDKAALKELVSGKW